MRNGICPKCGGRDVRSGEFLGEKERNGGHWGNGYMGNRLPIRFGHPNTAAWLDNYVCVGCGYVESYITDPKRLREIAEQWPAAPPDTPPGTQNDKGVWPPPPERPTT